MLLLPEDRLGERREAVRTGGPLAPLFESLAVELEPFLGHAPFIPREKALLSRAGGRCESCGAILSFDPWSPYRHRCPQCSRMHEGVLHDRAWVMPYQLWLAERVVHAALFALLRDDARHRDLASSTLRAYAEQYLAYPNSDNVLGPSRLFFSTYLESVWLLQICTATDLLEHAGDRVTAAIVRDRIIEPAAAIIREYDEGMSNRQVWNNAALMAAAAVCGDEAGFDTHLQGPSGLIAHLSRALLVDGTWYEGENYHQFALRGLWYGVILAECRGVRLPDELERRFQRAFATLFLTALPDFTLPSRKDSQYAVSLRQWRMAELAELGYARRPDPVLAGALARMYEGGHPRADTGRARSAADIERNTPATSLTRADLGWRALLHALPELPALSPLEPRSVMLDAQGYAVFRRAGGVYIGVDFGQSGGGHGHHDRLNLTLYQGDRRWLDDMGTGSYVDQSLFWYRSTLAHNAPAVNGKSQPIGDGRLLAYDERDSLGWIVAEFFVPDGGTRLQRTIVVTPDYLIDEVSWTAEEEVRIHLPWHLDAPPHAGANPFTLDASADVVDGFPFLRKVTAWPAVTIPPLFGGTTEVTLVTTADQPATLVFAEGPGQPPETSRRLALVETTGRRGTIRSVLTWVGFVNPWSGDDPPAQHTAADALTLSCRAGERHVHRRDDTGWHVELFAGTARSSIDLAGFRSSPAPMAEPPAERVPDVPLRLHRASAIEGWLDEARSAHPGLLTYELGKPHYRRSEQEWEDAGAPQALVAIGAERARLVILVRVEAGDPCFAPADAVNPFDNEHPDTMGAGIQLYLDRPDGYGAWMLVPEPETDRVRLRGIAGDAPPPRAHWRPRDHGYEVRLDVPLTTSPAESTSIALDLIVNETVNGRQRRRGQLVLSGARGEFVYLRGDRQDPGRLIRMAIVP